jgi:hypothetical protein
VYVVVALVFVVAFGACAAAASAVSPAGIQDGEYVPTITSAATLTLTVVDNGKKLVGGSDLSGSLAECRPNSAAASAGDKDDLTLTIVFPHSIPISASGTFSYSGTVKTAIPETTAVTTPIPTTLTLSGHFVLGKGKVKATFKASVCSASTPKDWSLVVVD